MKRSRNLRGLVALVAVASLVLAACGDDPVVDPPDPTDSPSPADDGPEPPPPDDDFDPDGTLRIAWPAPPMSFDPHASVFPSFYPFLSPVFEHLITSPSAGVFEGRLAESWDFAEDGTYLDLHLRQGIEFHDGTPFDAEAAKANIERARDLPESTAAGRLRAVESVEVIDEHTVRLVLSSPDSTIVASLSTNAGAMMSPASFDDPQVDRNPVGTGPYQVVEFEPGDRAAYERIGAYGDHWDPEAAKVARLEISFIGDPSARENALLDGQIDAMYVLTDRLREAASLDEGNDDLVLYMYDSENATQFMFNRTVSPIDDVRVRQAINFAIDRQGLVDALLGPGVSTAEQLFIEGTPGYVPEIEGTYTYDPDRARELLADAGYADGVTIPVLLSEQASEQAQAIQGMLADVGITVEFDARPSGGFISLWEEQQTAAAFSFLGVEVDPALLAQRFAVRFAFADVPEELAEFANQATDASLSEAERAAALQDYSRLFHEQSMNVMVARLDIGFLAYDYVTNLDAMSYTNLSIWDPRYLGVAAR